MYPGANCPLAMQDKGGRVYWFNVYEANCWIHAGWGGWFRRLDGPPETASGLDVFVDDEGTHYLSGDTYTVRLHFVLANGIWVAWEQEWSQSDTGEGFRFSDWAGIMDPAEVTVVQRYARPLHAWEEEWPFRPVTESPRWPENAVDLSHLPREPASVRLEADRQTVVVNGVDYAIENRNAFRLFAMIYRANGAYVTTAALDKECHTTRSGRLRRHLPPAVEALIQSDPGRGRGFRLVNLSPFATLPSKKLRRIHPELPATPPLPPEAFAPPDEENDPPPGSDDAASET